MFDHFSPPVLTSLPPACTKHLSDYEKILQIAPLPNFFPNAAAETKCSYRTLTERHMQALWLEQKYFTTLTTQDGTPIEILSPGIWNGEAGPDFLKAHIKIGSFDLRGDIELHLYEEGWYSHHHHLDTRYDHVILHICYWQPKQHRPILTSKGTRVNSVALEPKLTIPESRILKLIDLDLYPYQQFAGSGRCSKSLFKKMPERTALSLFRSAALWRLKDKWERLLASVDDRRHCLMAGIAMALGYKHNSEAFGSIFNNLLSSKIKDEHHLLANAMSMSGFFSERFMEKWGDSPIYQQLHALLKTRQNAPTDFTIALRLDGIRPANHPVRRLALMSKMIAGRDYGQIEERLISLWEANWKDGHERRWKGFKSALMELIPHYDDPYWNTHYLFEINKQKQTIALIGEDLKREIVVNILLPCLYSHILKTNCNKQLEAFSHFYSTMPVSKTRKGTYLDHRFFGDKGVESLLLKADVQQGAYQIHRDFCIHYEASCQGCPFVDRFTAAFGNKIDSPLNCK